MDRRSLLKFTSLLLAAPYPLANLTGQVAAQPAGRAWRHGMSLIGNPKYPAGFKHFDYVNASAPKGGSACQIALGPFDNFNMVVVGVKGSLVLGIDMTHETLFVSSLDEVSVYYGLLAESVSFPDDFSSAVFKLRPEAKWHDGQPVTPEDVIFSFGAFSKFSPHLAASLRHVIKVEKTGDREITFTFDGPGNRKLPQTIGQLTILSKAWWEGVDKDGKQRNVGETTLDPPLGSGPYRIKEWSPGRSIVYERVKDYWGNNLNVNIGRNNFDELRFEYFRDATVAIEAFKANTVDWRVENGAKNWATAYDFPAVTDKRVILEEFPINNIGIMQGFAFNIRREKFQDPRVRRAFNYLFDFEALNKQMFFGQYKRIASYFEGTDLAATGLPKGRELELLETVRDKIPPEVFTTPYTNPADRSVNAGPANLREAVQLFNRAGYEVQEQQLINAKTREPLSVELLGNNPLFERVFLFFKPSLERVGINVSVRTVDESQYVNRLRSWDFDIITYAWGESLIPGSEQRSYWGSQAADQAGSENVIGIKNPAVDTMIEKITFAKDYEELTAATRALDRILLWNHYVVPQWSYFKLRTARWDRFGRPQTLPKFAMSGFPALWWWDAEKAAKTGTRQ
jgi:microcin C transport system substrate-binding protein